MQKSMWLLMGSMLLTQPGWASEVTVDDAWVRLPPPVADTAVAYLVVKNHSATTLELSEVKSNVSAKAEFHNMDVKNGMMHMYRMPRVQVPAHAVVRFQAGGKHIMLVGLKMALHAGDKVKIILKFSNGEVVSADALVRDVRMHMSSGAM